LEEIGNCCDAGAIARVGCVSARVDGNSGVGADDVGAVFVLGDFHLGYKTLGKNSKKIQKTSKSKTAPLQKPQGCGTQVDT
jgi:hypothetical protein